MRGTEEAKRNRREKERCLYTGANDGSDQPSNAIGAAIDNLWTIFDLQTYPNITHLALKNKALQPKVSTLNLEYMFSSNLSTVLIVQLAT